MTPGETRLCGRAVFKTGAFNRSATLPRRIKASPSTRLGKASSPANVRPLAVCYYYVMRSIGERATDPGLLVLTSLAEGPKHGYAITVDVEQLSGVRLGPGTLYGALSRLEGRGLIEAMPPEDRRRPYRLTGAGSAALARELQTLEHVAAHRP